VDSVPGSVSFFNYVNSLKDKKGRKIDIFYISNRKDSIPVIRSTENQMKQLGFPQLVDSQFLFAGSTSSKEPRRQKVAATHNIVLLLGDNLIDLNAAFDNTAANPDRRLQQVNDRYAEWGSKYIVFPNAEYGDWEAALYPNGRYDKLGKEQTDRINALKTAHFTPDSSSHN
jgi:5'-nucleotidase (lipoprotein e(P4) family)